MNILITGASRGVGEIFRNYYLSKGHKVFGISRNQIAFNHNNYTHLAFDLSDSKKLEKELSNLSEVDVLINCAAIAKLNIFNFSTLADFENMMNTNLLSPFLLIRECSKGMIARKWGRVINISSVATVLNLKGEAQYIVSKAALEKMTTVLAGELMAFGVTVNTISISLADTKLLSGISEAQLQKVKDKLLCPDFLKEEEICHAADFFLAKEANNITGQHIRFGGV